MKRAREKAANRQLRVGAIMKSAVNAKNASFVATTLEVFAAVGKSQKALVVPSETMSQKSMI